MRAGDEAAYRQFLAKAAERLIGGLGDQRSIFRPAPARALDDSGRMRVTPRHMAYLKISEGCDRTCTFCAIPKMRGKHATKPIEEVVREARELAADGVKELVIVAQDTTYYGMDLYGEPRLVELLDALEEVEGIQWIRLMYLYPIFFTDQLVEKIASSRNSFPPIRSRFHVGEITISFRQTCGGISATKRIVRPRSSAFSIRSRSSGDGGTGRVLRMGVATSPG